MYIYMYLFTSKGVRIRCISLLLLLSSLSNTIVAPLINVSSISSNIRL